MDKYLNVDKILKNCHFTKKELSSLINVSRPTLNKCISQFESDGACSHKVLMILFSRLSGYENISKEIIDEEIKNAKNANIY